jgi:hypothetical protein
MTVLTLPLVGFAGSLLLILISFFGDLNEFLGKDRPEHPTCPPRSKSRLLSSFGRPA